MKLARFLLGASRRMVALIAVGGIINGLCGIGLIAIINRTAGGGASGDREEIEL